jgi:hypothetical protein
LSNLLHLAAGQQSISSHLAAGQQFVNSKVVTMIYGKHVLTQISVNTRTH